MKLNRKLPVAFAGAVLLMAAAALYGMYSLNQAIGMYSVTVQSTNAHARESDGLLISFKTQVQEWKNVLLRGKDAKQLDKHWAEFNKLDKDIEAKAKKLAAALPPGEAASLVAKFSVAHAAMMLSYRKGFEAFKAADFDVALGDAAVKGMDREPAKLLDEAGEKIAAMGAATAADAAGTARRATLFSLALMLVVGSASLIGGVWFSRQITRQLGADPTDAAEFVQRVSAGDLTSAIAVRSGDTSSLTAHLKTMQLSLANTVSQVRQNAEGVATASAQIAQGNNDLSSRTEEQASALEQTAASMEELSSTVKQNADNARQGNQLALSASSVAVKGGEVVGQVVQTMKGINDSSRKIADIIQVIDGIAFQTNILALNAAVEAARAGEQGRGFAVVASEVRSLAGRSADAAKEIKGLITASVERVEQGSALVDQAGATMSEVVSAIKRVTDIMGEISAASTEQSAGVAQVGEAVTQMDQATQQNAALVEESAAAAESLKAQAQQLVQAVSVFKLAHGQGASAMVPSAPMAPVAPRPAAANYPAVERRGPARSKNVSRIAPRSTEAAEQPTQPAARKTGTGEEWTSF